MKHHPQKHILLIVLLACGLLPMNTGAQTSTEHLYKILTGDGERLCTDPATGNSIISYNCHEIYTPISFIYHKENDTSTVQYKCTESVPPTLLTPSYDVNDIEIVGDYCYFCGTYYTESYEYVFDPFGSGNTQVLITTKTGYFGRFLVYEIANGINPMKIDFCIIPGTKSFSRLKGFVNLESGNNVNYLCLVGTTAADLSCLVTLKDNGTGASYALHAVTDASEVITDLALTGDYLVTASRINSDPYSFGLRAEMLPNVINEISYTTPLPLFPYLSLYNTSSVNTQNVPRPECPTFHPDDVEIKIAEIPGTNNAVVAYDCSGGAFDDSCYTDHEHTALFYTDDWSYYNPEHNSPTNILNAQLVSKGRKLDNTLTGLACPDRTSVILFHNYLPSVNGISGEIKFPSWSTYGDVENLTIDMRDMQDMYYDILNQKANLAGRMDADSKVIHFQQDVNVTGTSCYSTRPKAFSEKMSIPDMNIILTEFTRTLSSEDWGHTLNRPPAQAGYGISCETY